MTAKPASKPSSKATSTTADVRKPSKDELRAQVEALERTVARMKVKAKERRDAARRADARLTELETEVGRLESALVEASRAASFKAPRTAAARPRKQVRERDPGDAVPPGVAVQDPEPLDAEAEAARAGLEERLSGE